LRRRVAAFKAPTCPRIPKKANEELKKSDNFKSGLDQPAKTAKEFLKT
jgi:hypothetical protein